MASERKSRSRRLADDPRRDARKRANQNRRITAAFAIIGASVLVLAGILISGFVIKFVLPPRETIVKVNDATYTRGDLVKLVRVQQRGSEFLGYPLETATEVFTTLQNIVQNEILIQSAPKNGITVSTEEIEASIRGTVKHVSRGDSGQEEREFKEIYQGYLNAIQLSEEEHHELMKRSLLREKFIEFIGDKVPHVVEQVKIHRVMMLDNEEFDLMVGKYNDATERTKTAEEYQAAFLEVVREFSRDDFETVRKGGDLGWFPRGIMPDYDGLLFNLEIGEISERVPDYDREGAHFFFMVSENDPARPLRPEHRDILQSKAMTTWVNEKREEFDIFSALDSNIYDWVLEQLGFSEAPSTNQPVLPDFSRIVTQTELTLGRV